MCVFAVLSDGRAPSSEFGLNPEPTSLMFPLPPLSVPCLLSGSFLRNLPVLYWPEGIFIKPLPALSSPSALSSLLSRLLRLEPWSPSLHLSLSTSRLHLGPPSLRLHRASSSLLLHLTLWLVPPALSLCRAPPYLRLHLSPWDNSTEASSQPLVPAAPPWSPGPSVLPDLFSSS